MTNGEYIRQKLSDYQLADLICGKRFDNIVSRAWMNWCEKHGYCGFITSTGEFQNKDNRTDNVTGQIWLSLQYDSDDWGESKIAQVSGI